MKSIFNGFLFNFLIDFQSIVWKNRIVDFSILLKIVD